jgi:hypothetical protein
MVVQPVSAPERAPDEGPRRSFLFRGNTAPDAVPFDVTDAVVLDLDEARRVRNAQRF